ncbi:MAG: ComEC/Rec2 family competence protein [Cyanobacteria bacterium J06639_1]
MLQTYWIGCGWLMGLFARSLHLAGWWLLPAIAIGIGLGRRDRRLVATWIVTGIVALLGWGYFGWRVPTPSPLDISQLAPQSQVRAIARVESVPKLKQSGRIQVWTQAETVSSSEGAGSLRDGIERDVTGKMFVTYAQEDDTPELLPGQTVSIEGSLYLPRGASNPGSFNFRRFLAQNRSFVGMSVRQMQLVDSKSRWGGWVLRQRIRQGLRDGLGDRAGELLSAIVLGAAASEVPFDLQESFRTAGLAHVMAASGFHVVILIGVMRHLTRWLPPRRQAGAILTGILGYVVLTGGSPSVCRAAVMGGAAVLAQGWSDRLQTRRLNPVGVLLVAVVLLTIWQPLWVDNVGFRLSATATLGLLVSATPIANHLAWMPKSWAETLSVPLAAALWTLPLQLLTFGKVPTYCLLANCLAMPLVVPLTVAGFVGCGLCAIAPPLGAFAVKLAYVPLVALANGVSFIAGLPGASFHTGTVSIGQCLGLYALLGLWTWRSPIQPALQPRWQAIGRRWIAGVLTGLLLVSLLWPAPKIQLVALATADAPVLAIRTRRSVTLINSGSPETVQYAWLPFLRSEGIRRIQHAIALTPDSRSNGAWHELVRSIPIRQFWRSDRQAIAGDYAAAIAAVADSGAMVSRPQAGDLVWTEGDIQLQVIQTQPMVLQLAIGEVTWLLLGEARPTPEVLDSHFVTPPIDWVWWDGGELGDRAVNSLDIRRGIASGRLTNSAFLESPERNSAIVQTRNEGAVAWTLQGITLARPDRD